MNYFYNKMRSFQDDRERAAEMTIPRVEGLPKRCVALTAAFAVALVSVCIVPTTADSSDARPELETSASVGDYTFRIYDIRCGMIGWRISLLNRLVIEQAGRIVDEFEEQHIFIGPRAMPFWDRAPPIPLGKDITGDGEPNMLVATYSGGAHCCYSYHIYSVGEAFRKVQEFHTGDSPMSFSNLDDDPALEAELCDYNFAYWNTGFASSPAPRVALKYRDGKYRFAPELMRRPAISEETLRREAQALRNSEYWGSIDVYPYDFRLWDIMLELIYTGHYDRARQFLDEGWPPDFPGKERFRYAFFDCQLRRSEYWPGVAAMNGIPADPPLPDCPPCPECG